MQIPGWMNGEHGCIRVRRQLLAGCCALGLVLGVMALATPRALADSRDAGTENSGASNGGVATATTDGDITIGEIVTGENTGNSINTGDIAGSAELNGGQIDYPTNVNITQNLEAPIALAGGGDNGVAGPGLEPELNIDIDNRDKTNNKSTATGIGEGGSGGAGGTGGDVTVNTGGAP